MSKFSLLAVVVTVILEGCSSTPPVPEAYRLVCDDIVQTLSSDSLLNEIMSKILPIDKQDSAANQGYPQDKREKADAFRSTHFLFNRKAITSPVEARNMEADQLRAFYDQQASFAATMNLPDGAGSTGSQMLWKVYQHMLDTFPCDSHKQKMPPAPEHENGNKAWKSGVFTADERLSCDVLARSRLQLEKFRVNNPVSSTAFYRTLLHYPEFSQTQEQHFYGQEFQAALREFLVLHYGNYPDIAQLFIDHLLVTGRITYSVITLFIDKPWLDNTLYRSLADKESMRLGSLQYPYKVVALDYLNVSISLSVPAEAMKTCGLTSGLTKQFTSNLAPDKILILGIWYKVPP